VLEWSSPISKATSGREYRKNIFKNLCVDSMLNTSRAVSDRPTPANVCSSQALEVRWSLVVITRNYCVRTSLVIDDNLTQKGTKQNYFQHVRSLPGYNGTKIIVPATGELHVLLEWFEIALYFAQDTADFPLPKLS